MRIRLLLIGDDPAALIPDGQLLRDHNILVFTAFNMQNVPDLINEIKPDLLFFDAQQQSDTISETYNAIVNSNTFGNLPVIFSLTEDDLYLITRKRSDEDLKRNFTSDNIVEAIRLALTPVKATKQQGERAADRPHQYGGQLPIYFR